MFKIWYNQLNINFRGVIDYFKGKTKMTCDYRRDDAHWFLKPLRDPPSSFELFSALAHTTSDPFETQNTWLNRTLYIIIEYTQLRDIHIHRVQTSNPYTCIDLEKGGKIKTLILLSSRDQTKPNQIWNYFWTYLSNTLKREGVRYSLPEGLCGGRTGGGLLWSWSSD